MWNRMSLGKPSSQTGGIIQSEIQGCDEFRRGLGEMYLLRRWDGQM